MKKFILTALSVILVSTIVQAQQSWTKIDTVRVQVQFTGTEVTVNPEPSERLGDEFWDLVLGSQVFTDVEQIRTALKPYDFRSTSCYLDPESSSLVFCFEKVIIESETLWKREQ